MLRILLLCLPGALSSSVCGSCGGGENAFQPSNPSLALFCGSPGDSIKSLDYISWGDNISGQCGAASNATDKCDNGGNSTRLRSLLEATCLGNPACQINVSTNFLGSFCAKGGNAGKTFSLTIQATCTSGSIFSQCGSLYDPGLQFAGVFSDWAVLQRAPQQAALYGYLPVGAFPQGASVKVSLANDIGGEPIVVSAPVASDGSWKAVFPPQEPNGGGSYTATAECTDCLLPWLKPATLKNLTFGDVWMCSGQSNVQLPMSFTFELNNTLQLLRSGAYPNIRYYQIEYAPSYSDPMYLMPRYVPSAQNYRWTPATNLVNSAVDNKNKSIDWLPDVYATCFYFARALTDHMTAAGAVVPIGILASAQGGTSIEQWTPASAQGACTNIGCLCSTPHCNSSQPFNAQNCTGNGGLYNSMVAPLVNMSILGHIWYQGENNMGGYQGNVEDATGYACLLKQMINSWRSVWSTLPGTTPLNSPFGIATMHYGSAEGSPQHVALSNWAHTLNFGSLPSPDFPGTFLAQNTDVGDPWDCPGCNHAQACCVPKSVPLGPTCWGDYRGLWDDSTPGLMGGIHARTKWEMGKRFAHGAWYGAAYQHTESPASGPVISGCTLAIDASSLTLTFNTSLLRGAELLVRPPEDRPYFSQGANETSMTYVLAGIDLPEQCDAGDKMWKGGAGAFQGGGECFQNPLPKGIPGWVNVEISKGGAQNEVFIDLSRYPSLKGFNITAVRHMWGYAMCCGARQSTWPGWVSEPCPPYSCPLIVNVSSRGSSEILPAVGFMSRIDASSKKCVCLRGQTCSE